MRATAELAESAETNRSSRGQCFLWLFGRPCCADVEYWSAYSAGFADSDAVAFRYGICDGGMRRFVACSNAYAISMSFGSLQASPTNAALYGDGFGSKPA